MRSESEQNQGMATASVTYDCVQQMLHRKNLRVERFARCHADRKVSTDVVDVLDTGSTLQMILNPNNLPNLLCPTNHTAPGSNDTFTQTRT